MKNPTDWQLSEASGIFSIANTPLFLIRKLQADPEVRAISEACSGEQILDALESALQVAPASPVEAVRPYAFLVALWLLPTPNSLRDAVKFSAAAESWHWFNIILGTLIETFSHVESQTIQIPPRVEASKSNIPPMVVTVGQIVINPQ